MDELRLTYLYKYCQRKKRYKLSWYDDTGKEYGEPHYYLDKLELIIDLDRQVQEDSRKQFTRYKPNL